jgi:hypothetical protein
MSRTSKTGQPSKLDLIALLSSELSMDFNDTFMSKRTHCDTGDGLRRGEHVYKDHQVVDIFTRAGFTLE